MTKNLKTAAFEYHKNFSLLVQESKPNRCTCLCLNKSGPNGVERVRCLSLCDGLLCDACKGTCRCPCWGGCDYLVQSDQQHEEFRVEEGAPWAKNLIAFVERRRRRQRKNMRAYRSHTDGDGPPKDKRRAVDDAAEPGAAERPAVAAPAAPAPVPGAPVAPKPKPPAPIPAAPVGPPVVHLPDQDNDPVDDLSEQVAQMSLERVRARVAKAAAKPKANPNPRPTCGHLTAKMQPCKNPKAAGLKWCSLHCAKHLESGGSEDDLRE